VFFFFFFCVPNESSKFGLDRGDDRFHRARPGAAHGRDLPPEARLRPRPENEGQFNEEQFNLSSPPALLQAAGQVGKRFGWIRGVAKCKSRHPTTECVSPAHPSTFRALHSTYSAYCLRLQLYAESLYRFGGSSPYIYPLYGLGELPQVRPRPSPARSHALVALCWCRTPWLPHVNWSLLEANAQGPLCPAVLLSI